MKGHDGKTLLNALCECEPQRSHDRALVEGLINDGIRWRRLCEWMSSSRHKVRISDAGDLSGQLLVTLRDFGRSARSRGKTLAEAFDKALEKATKQ